MPVVCDALGARQIVGIGSVTSRFFCTLCNLPIQDVENIDCTTWPPRDVVKHRADAKAWRDADSDNRVKLFKQNGTRWTALLDLPYWDPIKFLVIDTMHNLYLGLLQHHCRDVWGMNIAYEDGDATRGAKGQPKVPTPEEMNAGRAALAGGFEDKLKAFNRPILYYMCDELGLRRAGTKAQLITELLRWVRINNSSKS